MGQITGKIKRNRRRARIRRDLLRVGLVSLLLLSTLVIYACAAGSNRPAGGRPTESVGMHTQPDTEELTDTEPTDETGSQPTSDTGKDTEQESVSEKIPDAQAPVITGTKNITVELGGAVAYRKGVEVTDDSGEEITLQIDNSAVDLQKPGVYEVVYSATDSSGNTTQQRITVTVTEVAQVTEEEVHALADAVIAQVIKPGMTQYEQAEALWKWCRREIDYSFAAGKRTELDGAYEGLHDKKGDCWVYYATYALLLTRTGIENMCVARVGGASNHWWNLVNVGDGWYHCDASPRQLQDKFFKTFMQTDAQVAEYSIHYEKNNPGHPNYYGFDGALYPERGTEIIVENKYPEE